MSPAVPPESGDIDMWSHIAKAAQQSLLSAIMWGQQYGQFMAIAGLAAWLFGMERDLEGRKLRLAVASGLLFAYVGTPLCLHYFGLTPSLWQGAVAFFLSVTTWRVIKWVEVLLLRYMGIERRQEGGD